MFVTNENAPENDNYDLHPMLNEFVSALWLKNPSLSFEKYGKKNLGISDKESIIRCRVILGYEKLGFVAIKSIYTNQGYQMVWEVQSPNVIKSRGDSNTTRSKVLKNITQSALKVFVPTDINALAHKIIDICSEQIFEMLSNARRPYHELIDSCQTIAYDYALDVFTNKETATFPDKLRTTFESAKFKELSNNHRIVNSIYNSFKNHKSGVVIRIEEDETLNVADLQTHAMMLSVKSTYDLPKNYQEKFAILKIMDRSQPIEGVGVKVVGRSHNRVAGDPHEYYYLVGGDTPIIE